MVVPFPLVVRSPKPDAEHQLLLRLSPPPLGDPLPFEPTLAPPHFSPSASQVPTPCLPLTRVPSYPEAFCKGRKGLLAFVWVSGLQSPLGPALRSKCPHILSPICFPPAGPCFCSPQQMVSRPSMPLLPPMSFIYTLQWLLNNVATALRTVGRKALFLQQLSSYYVPDTRLSLWPHTFLI